MPIFNVGYWLEQGSILSPVLLYGSLMKQQYVKLRLRLFFFFKLINSIVEFMKIFFFSSMEEIGGGSILIRDTTYLDEHIFFNA